MRKEIEPLWEDPQNKDGGTFSITIAHEKGFEIWSSFIYYIIGETLCDEMEYINGISVSSIISTNPNSIERKKFLLIKIWDGKKNRTKDEFLQMLNKNLYEQIKNEQCSYVFNNSKKDFNEKKIVHKLYNNKVNYGGFKMS
jgi:hypothetical protein